MALGESSRGIAAQVATRPAETAHGAAVGPAGVDASNQRAAAALMNRMVSDVPPAWTQSNGALLNGTLNDLDLYAQQHPDFSAHGESGSDNDILWKLVVLARGNPGVVAGLGAFRVRDVIAAGIFDAKRAALLRYAKAVSGALDSTVLSPAATLTRAAQYGKALLQLDTVLIGTVQYDVILGNCLDTLIDTAGVLTGFIEYCRVVKPLLTSRDGADIDAFVQFFNETGGEVTRYVGKLKHVRNHHHFEVTALEQLSANEGDKSHQRPLTVVVYTAQDWNGAFTRAPAVTDMVYSRKNLVIAIEGTQSLADAGADVSDVAATYGQGGKVDQLLLAGHGNNRSMQMSAHHDAQGELATDDIDLDGNAKHTDAFLRRVLGTMSPDSPHGRIVLFACLTDSDTLPARASAHLGADPTAARRQMSRLLKQNESLAAHVRAMAETKNATTIAANGSFEPTRLIDQRTGSLVLVSRADSALTADKLTYIRDGFDPTGALRALMSSWAHDPVAAKAAVEARLGVPAGFYWNGVLIRVLYKMALAHWNDPEVIARLPEEADVLSELQFDRAISASTIAQKVPLSDRAFIFDALSASEEWRHDYVKVVGLQVMGETDSNARSTFFSLLARSYDARRLAPYIRSDDAMTLSLLKGTEGSPLGRVMYAIVVLKKYGNATAHQFLTSLRHDGTFPPSSQLQELLGGFSTESELASMLEPTGDAHPGKPGSGGPNSTTAVAHKPNIDLDGDGHDDVYITPAARDVMSSSNITLYDRPKVGARVVGTIAAGQNVRVCGVVGEYDAVVIPDRTRVAFVSGRALRTTGG